MIDCTLGENVGRQETPVCFAGTHRRPGVHRHMISSASTELNVCVRGGWRHRLAAQERKEARERQPDAPEEDAIVVDVRLAALLDVPETRPEWQQNVSRHAAANASNHDAQMLQYTALGESENANNTGPSVE
jgi:hypothetical protein